MQIVFASAEVAPFARTGGLGDVCGALPKALAALGHEVIIFTPYYGETGRYFERNPDQPRPEPVIHTTLHWSWWSLDLTLLRGVLPGTSIATVFVANEHFFARSGLYSPADGGWDDNPEKFAFFCRAVIRACELLAISPDVIHAHDWHTALLPVYLESGLRAVPNYRASSSVFTIHNLQYQGRCGQDRFGFLGLHDSWLSPAGIEYYGDLNPMKGGIRFADEVTTVSPNYAREIRTPEGGAGLDGIVRSRGERVTGILNGIDTEEWNPATDRLIDARFEPGKMLGKKISKRMLCRELGLKFHERTPVVGFVSRLVDQKGIDLLLSALPRLMPGGAQFVLLGNGERHYEEALRYIEGIYPAQVRALTTFDSRMAHRIIAGSDLLLMPSLYEPCGLNQMYSLRYGTLPVVRMTGGLADTVIPFAGSNRRAANGFGFYSADGEGLFAATDLGLRVWKDTRTRKRLQENGMAVDFSWETSARRYVEVYLRSRLRHTR